MGRVSFQVLDGLERGEVFEDLSTPVSIGREEENGVRLNDERVSRFHAKIQEQNGRYILTDLDSTNGTRVNGHPVQMHVLRIGDQLLIGRCLLVYGSPAELEAQCQATGDQTPPSVIEGHQTQGGNEELPDMFPGGPPALPASLTGVQTAELADVLAYLHSNLLQSLYTVQGDSNSQTPLTEVTLSATAWHRLQRLQMQLSQYLAGVAQPQTRES